MRANFLTIKIACAAALMIAAAPVSAQSLQVASADTITPQIRPDGNIRDFLVADAAMVAEMREEYAARSVIHNRTVAVQAIAVSADEREGHPLYLDMARVTIGVLAESGYDVTVLQARYAQEYDRFLMAN